MDSKHDLIIEDYSNLAGSISGAYLMIPLLIVMLPFGLLSPILSKGLLAFVIILLCATVALRDLIRKKAVVLRFGRETDVIRGEAPEDVGSYDKLSHFIMDYDWCIPRQVKFWLPMENMVFNLRLFEKRILKRGRFSEWFKSRVETILMRMLKAESLYYCGFVVDGDRLKNLILTNKKDYDTLKQLMLEKGVPTYRVDESRRVIRCN